MNDDDALRIVSSYGPCPHFNLITDLGNGKIWALCEDCGEEIAQQSVQQYRSDSLAFERAIEMLDKLINPLIEVKT